MVKLRVLVLYRLAALSLAAALAVPAAAVTEAMACQRTGGDAMGCCSSDKSAEAERDRAPSPALQQRCCCDVQRRAPIESRPLAGELAASHARDAGPAIAAPAPAPAVVVAASLERLPPNRGPPPPQTLVAQNIALLL